MWYVKTANPSINSTYFNGISNNISISVSFLFLLSDKIQDGKLSLNGVDELAKATTNNDAKKMKIAHEIAEQCVNVSDEDE